MCSYGPLPFRRSDLTAHSQLHQICCQCFPPQCLKSSNSPLSLSLEGKARFSLFPPPCPGTGSPSLQNLHLQGYPQSCRLKVVKKEKGVRLMWLACHPAFFTVLALNHSLSCSPPHPAWSVMEDSMLALTASFEAEAGPEGRVLPGQASVASG